MKQFRLVPLVLAVAVWAGLLAGCQKAEGQTAAATVDLSTPESAVSAYMTGVKQQDFNAIIATTAARKAAEGFDFVGSVVRLRTLTLHTPAPSNAPLFIELNNADFVAQIAKQVKLLAFGLMTTNEVVQGKAVVMEEAGAKEFLSAVRADRLSGIELVKIGIPQPSAMMTKPYQVRSANIAKINGADATTERVALISFEGLHFVVGFSLLQYGDNWMVSSQVSPLARTDTLGATKRVTPDEFEVMLK